MTARGDIFFALRKPPRQSLIIGETTYRLERVFKHDFWAATCLYRTDSPEAELPAVVLKFGREQSFLGLPLQWVGPWLADREQRIYDRLAGLDGVPRWAARPGPNCYAIEYVDAPPLDHLERPPDGFFDRLRELLEAIHARGVAYGDANKKSNILIRPDGFPVLIDFQISLARRPGWPRPLRWLLDRVIDYLQQKDIYHLCKHKRRLRPDELRPEEESLSRRRSGLHALHRKLTKPYRSLRRRFLRDRQEKGLLQSPTGELEDHHQPEKNTWRQG